MLNHGENRTRDLGVTGPHAMPSELHGHLGVEFRKHTSLYQLIHDQHRTIPRPFLDRSFQTVKYMIWVNKNEFVALCQTELGM